MAINMAIKVPTYHERELKKSINSTYMDLDYYENEIKLIRQVNPHTHLYIVQTTS